MVCTINNQIKSLVFFIFLGDDFGVLVPYNSFITLFITPRFLSFLIFWCLLFFLIYFSLAVIGLHSWFQVTKSYAFFVSKFFFMICVIYLWSKHNLALYVFFQLFFSFLCSKLYIIFWYILFFWRSCINRVFASFSKWQIFWGVFLRSLIRVRVYKGRKMVTTPFISLQG